MKNVDGEVGAEDDWEDEGIFYSCKDHDNEDEDVCDDNLKSVLEDDWEDDGIFKACREQIDVDLELWDDDESMNSEESINVGDGRRRSLLKKFKPTLPSAIIRV
eukprot:3604529-Ditylum_brightwellii.AAC.1